MTTERKKVDGARKPLGAYDGRIDCANGYLCVGWQRDFGPDPAAIAYCARRFRSYDPIARRTSLMMGAEEIALTLLLDTSAPEPPRRCVDGQCEKQRSLVQQVNSPQRK